MGRYARCRPATTCLDRRRAYVGGQDGASAPPGRSPSRATRRSRSGMPHVLPDIGKLRYGTLAALSMTLIAPVGSGSTHTIRSPFLS